MRPATIAAATLAILLLTFILSLSFGTGAYDLAALVRYGFSASAPDEALALLLASRLPRALAAPVVGGGLALSATLLQTLTRNPLAEPGLLGVNAGAVLGLTIGLSYFAAGSTQAFMLWAGGGALVAITVVLGVARLSRRTSPPHLILIGIATSAILGGIASHILMSFATALDQFRFWTLGSLSGVKLAALAKTAPYSLAALIAVVLMARPLAVMQLGDDQAKSMGVSPHAVTLGVWIVTATLTACAVAIAGPVTFVGFLAAYLARLAVGPRLGWQLACSALFGTVLVLAADLCARLVIRPYEVPVGVVIALLGAPLTVAVSRSRLFRDALVRD